MELDVVIVGAGLFGSILGKALSQAGRQVTLFDDRRPEAGSIPAACLIKPSWITSLGKPIYEPALAMLEALYEVQIIKFKTGPLFTDVYWIPPKEILSLPYQKGTVRRIMRDGQGWGLIIDDKFIHTRMVVVAAGIWSSLLLPEVKQKSLAGMAFLWSQEKIDQPFIKPWAPYKQVVGFNRGDGLWIGDGSAILRQNWTEEYAQKSYLRCAGFSSIPPKRLFGIRPYHENKQGLLKEVKPNLWVASGGAKNGTLAAGWCAYEIVRLTQ